MVTWKTVLSAGEIAGMIKSLRPAKQIIEELFAGTHDVVKNLRLPK